MRIDVGTLAFATAVVALAMAAVQLFLAPGNECRELRRALAVSAATYGTGLLIIIGWPREGWALASGNALVMASACACHAAAYELVGRRPPYVGYSVAVAFVGAVFVALVAMAPREIGLRVTFISAVRIPLFAHALWLLRPAMAGGGGKGMAVLRWSYALFFALISIRVVDSQFFDQVLRSFLDRSGYQAFYFLGTGGFFILTSIAFILLVSERHEEVLTQAVADKTMELKSAKEAAENALTAKSKFLAATGHDLRQATHAMKLLLAAVSEELSSRPAERKGLAALTDEIGKLVTAMSDQLSGLLEMARLESGEVVPVRAECRLGDLLECTASRFSHLARANDVDLRVIDSSLWAETDPQLLDRIVGNVIHNAIKFGAGGRVIVGCRRGPRGCSVQVWDEGIGIPPDQVSVIFDEYRQLDSTVKQAGLGLGLAIASRTAHLLGCTLEARPRRRGTCFAVEFGGRVVSRRS